MYERMIRFSWDTDSVSDREYAITNLTGLARELSEIAAKVQNLGDDWDYSHRSPLYFPPELSDEEAWLDFAMERIQSLGHKVEWRDWEPTGTCVVRLRGDNYPLLLGYQSRDWLRNNLQR